MSDQFIINRLRKEPFTYTVEISHFVADGQWKMGITLKDVSMDDGVDHRRVASDLRRAAAMLDAVDDDEMG